MKVKNTMSVKFPILIYYEPHHLVSSLIRLLRVFIANLLYVFLPNDHPLNALQHFEKVVPSSHNLTPLVEN